MANVDYKEVLIYLGIVFLGSLLAMMAYSYLPFKKDESVAK